MAIPAADIISRVGEILQDRDHIRWPIAELLQWMNDGASEIIVRRPGARAVSGVFALVDGTRQEIPMRGVMLLDVVRNMGLDGKTPGRVVRRIDRQLLDDQSPDWHAAKKANAIRHYTFDDRSPKEFYVYPPANAGIRVEARYSELPPVVTDEGDDLDLPPEYLTPLLSYVAYLACLKDSEFANGGVAAIHYRAFNDAMASTVGNAVDNSPNAHSV